MTRLLLVRHGESEWNAVGRWQGWADPPLTELGMRQAKGAARRVGHVDAIVTSDLRRAAHTAELIAAELGVGPLVVEPALRERDAGPWTSLTRNEIEAQWPGALERWDTPEGYEDDEHLVARVVPALLALERYGDDVLVVSHGGVIGAVERQLGQPHARTPNLGGRVLHAEDGQLVAGEVILLVDAHEVSVTAPPET